MSPLSNVSRLYLTENSSWESESCVAHVLSPGWAVLCIASTACQTSGREKLCLWSEIWWVSTLIYLYIPLTKCLASPRFISLSALQSATSPSPALFALILISPLLFSLPVFVVLSTSFTLHLCHVCHCTWAAGPMGHIEKARGVLSLTVTSAGCCHMTQHSLTTFWHGLIRDKTE